MSTLSVTGCDLYYGVHGEGPETIVFAHGAGGNHLSWWQQVPHFRERYRCVTFDHRGFGQSVDRSGEGIAAFRRDLEQLLDALEVADAVLVGQSMGGFTVLPFAVAHPERVRALLMADTFLGIWDEELLAAMAAAVQQAIVRADAGGQTAMLGPDYVRTNPNGTFLYQQVRALTSPVPGGGAMSFGVDQGAVLPEQLSALTMPVVFLAGEFDAIIPAALVERAHRHVPGSRFVSVADGGHSVYWELPEQFNGILDGLLGEAYPAHSG
ncbi:MAG: alpha/beta hydrolase [Chloroflexi bacterium]|nr:alpha/beta hydrolase [Chloroflexota bacterium]MDA1003763.1 alpha/beta hydrolase [Chloroflexota bacterium]